MLDTAYVYARELAFSDRPLNKSIGFSILLTPELRNYSSIDTLLSYISQYSELIKKKLSTNESELIINRYNFYDYSRHEKDKQRLIHSNANLRRLVYCLFAALFIAGAAIVLMQLRWKEVRKLNDNYHNLSKAHFRIAENINTNQINTSELNKVSDGVQQLKTTLETVKILNKQVVGGSFDFNVEESQRQHQADLLLEEIKRRDKVETPSLITDSEVCRRLHLLASRDESIPYDSRLWDEMGTTLSLLAPNFKPRLEYLTEGKLTQPEWEFAMLIKYGMSFKEITILLARAKGAVGSRRSSLGQKIFGDRLPSSDIIKAIKLL